MYTYQSFLIFLVYVFFDAKGKQSDYNKILSKIFI
jgi:hypothetical protein